MTRILLVRPIAAAHGLEPVVGDALGEVRFGEWTGRTFEELARDERWLGQRPSGRAGP